MDIGKGDLVKVWDGTKMSWAITCDLREDAVFCYCLEEEEDAYFEEWEIEQVVHAEPTDEFLSVLSQKEKLAYASYYLKEAGNMLTDIENRISGNTGGDLNKLAKTYGITSTTKPFKYRVEEGILHPIEINVDLSDGIDETVKNVLTRWDTSGNWVKDKELFDPFDDQTPYPLDFDNFDYGDVEQCYDEERDYLVIKCVDDFIEHMMTTR